MSGADYAWCKAVQDAFDAGDMERARSLGVLASHLLDLAEPGVMPRSLWDEMYAKVSERAGVKPKLALVKSDNEKPKRRKVRT
jgi:hypothetical protein